MRLRLRVTPKSRADEITGLTPDGIVKVRVTAPAQEGKANDAVVRLLSRALGVPASAVRIRGGAASRDKWIEVDGLPPEEARRRLRREPG